ncbi:gamma-glutamylcyclotransferase-like [Centroberyx gerrardi]|uniref:gamma-glutamylcyclotransferase-like n=1 Tax=Centroberyx gerrardi TaxID=166262 RepID=UPI003AAC079F
MYFSYGKICFFLFYIQVALMAASIPTASQNNGTLSNCSDHFLYFAYGSNLLTERLHLRNPSATFVTTGSLKNHTIQFGHWTKNFNGSNSWHGGVATIEKSEGEYVWGVIWRLSMENLISLDKQEGVSIGMYRPLEVTVDTVEGEVLCRTYQMNNFTPYLTSDPYKLVVCLGAKQHNLPLDYIKKLEAVETNGYSGPSILDEIKVVNPPEKNT